MTSGPSVTRAHPFVEAARHVGKPRGPGYVRDRFVYAPAEGVFHTKAWTGDAGRAGQEVAAMGLGALTAPLDGVLRGVAHDGAPVTLTTKIIEVEAPRACQEVRGIAGRPRRIAEGVLSAVREWERQPR